MLDSVTKKRIDDLRNILVGKIPSPQSQVEQITTGLIYKFMYDMDTEAVEMGGVPSFFVGDYEKYSWKHLFNPKLGGADKVRLYSDAIENMYTNPTASPLFREIFKNSFLPFKDPSTLNMFLKEINEFHYSHSEKLGDAFEYLLSFMGSQGDAGQFRTPRHIIDFIVEIVNPQKNETILDPACGTAGFLISSYKHILNKNTDKRLGDKLTAAERKQVGDNLTGYDISPDMTRISLVNMYLHKFASPKIHEYDTLSSEDRWNEYYDVILANPPFFSPTGGIQPHSRFGVQSTRAEVLFVDYIMEHLKPTGRAGIVVPEGIIFQTGTAYKTLRKKLIEDSLVGVISMPAGVFQPYSGVKTSILILDKERNQNSDSIFFAKVENDGFSLGAQRTPISKNDLPETLEKFRSISNLSESEIKNHLVLKTDVLGSTDIGLSQSRYQVVDRSFVDIQFVTIGEVCNVFNGSTPNRKNDEYWYDGDFPWFTIEDLREQGYLIRDTKQKITQKAIDETSVKILPPHTTLLCCTASVGATAFSEISLTTNQQFNGLVLKKEYETKLIPKFLYWVTTNLTNELIRNSGRTSFNFISVTKVKEIEIPLPPIEVQQEIANELEGYQKIIDGCRQVVENYKPTIDIDPSWEMVELGEMATTEYGTSEKSLQSGKYGVLRMGNLQGGEIDFSDLVYSNNEKDFEKLHLIDGDILFNRTNSPELVGKTSIFRGHDNPMIFAGYLVRVKVDESKLLPEYLNAVLNSPYGQMLNDKNVSVSGNQANINATKLKNYPIFTPPFEVQKRICSSLDAERKIVSGNKELIKIFKKKIQDRISKVWGE
jgi:type I restriction enzyme M protein